MFHALTKDQMRKLMDAVGSTSESAVVEGGNYSTFRLKKLAEMAGGLQDWPKMTDDPRVNFAVDSIVADFGERPAYEEELYVREAEAFKARIRSLSV